MPFFKPNLQTKQLNELMFLILEVPMPEKGSTLEKKSAFKKAILQNKDSIKRLVEKQGTKFFIDYSLVIMKILQDSNTKITTDCKEYSSLVKSFEELGMSDALKFLDKFDIKQKVNEVINKNELHQTDINAFLEKMQKIMKEYNIIGNPAKILIYHATFAARADGNYTPEEKEAIRKVAERMGVTKEDFDLLQKLVRVQARFHGIQVSSINLKEHSPEQELDDLYKEVLSKESKTKEENSKDERRPATQLTIL